MYYLIIESEHTPKMYWNGFAFTFNEDKAKKYIELSDAYADMEVIIIKSNYLKDLIQVCHCDPALAGEAISRE